MANSMQGFDQMLSRIDLYERRVMAVIRNVAEYWKAVLVAYAKENAAWTDRTANARQSLHAFIEDLSGDIVRLYLSGGVNYQIFLETKYAGRYAIIWPTIKRHLGQIRKMLQDIFGRR